MKKYFLIGEKLGHSYSAELHGFNGINYGLKEIPRDKLPAFFCERNFDGLNVTIPYKKEVMRFLDEIDDKAAMLGAVNTVVNDGGKLIGYNTDYFGMEYAFKSLGISLSGRNVVVLGTGGAGVTAKALAKNSGAASVTVVSRKGGADFLTYEEIYRKSETEIIINATPVGMFPAEDETPLDIGKFPSLVGVFDCIYNPLRTNLVLAAKTRGINCGGGLMMLAAQGVQSEKIWGCFEGETESKISSVYNKLLFKKRNIVLIGMPGAGKTSVGRVLAEKLSKKFIDIDEEIKKITGKSPEEIIGTYGEAKFREIESEVSGFTAKENGAVIATGGGTFLNEKNAVAFQRQGVIIYIERQLEKLETANRPISRSVPISRLFAQREPIYLNYCDEKIANDTTIPVCADEIIKRLI